MDGAACNIQDQQTLTRRANELFHDLEAGSFDWAHRFRHRAERGFWAVTVPPHLAAGGFGVDLCTGTGFVPRVVLAQMDAAARMLCLDVSEQALRQARRSLRSYDGRVTFRACDAATIPLPDASADWVTLNAGLHHLPRPERTLREVDRVLKCGGCFCLGFEPNAAFFRCRGLALLERAIWKGFWYLSPRRNWVRARRLLGRAAGGQGDQRLRRLSAALLREGLIGKQLSAAELGRLIDVHACRGDAGPVGLDWHELLRRCFPGYRVQELLFSDYGGEMLRPHPLLRRALDGLLAAACRGRGMLFSWIIRKEPDRPGGRDS